MFFVMLWNLGGFSSCHGFGKITCFEFTNFQYYGLLTPMMLCLDRDFRQNFMADFSFVGAISFFNLMDNENAFFC